MRLDCLREWTYEEAKVFPRSHRGRRALGHRGRRPVRIGVGGHADRASPGLVDPGDDAHSGGKREQLRDLVHDLAVPARRSGALVQQLPTSAGEVRQHCQAGAVVAPTQRTEVEPRRVR